MAYDGEEMQQYREQFARFANRLNGRGNNLPIQTIAAHEGYTDMAARTRLPKGDTLFIQDAQGNFEYLPGYDGPVDPTVIS